MKRILLGPPGTGKTTALLNLVEQALSSGVLPSEIGYLAFTKAAAEEAVERACARFPFKRDEFVYFRTIHALAFKLLGLRKDEVMSPAQWKEFGMAHGYKFSGVDFEGFSRWSSTVADECLRIYQYARAMFIQPVEAGRMLMSKISEHQLNRFMIHLRTFKEDSGLIDFYDFIDNVSGALPLKLLIVDEAQDLTRSQWRLIHKWSEGVPEVVVAGDDDQAIFEWAGADVESFLTLDTHGYTREVLSQSWRIPNSVKILAEKVASRILKRYDKPYRAREDSDGVVEFVPTWSSLTKSTVFEDKDVLVVCRTHKQAQNIEALLRSSGVAYDYNGVISTRSPALKAILAYKRMQKEGELTKAEFTLLKKFGWKEGIVRSAWPNALTLIDVNERLYFTSLERSGVDLEAPANVRIRTIHGAKGAEASSVVLYFDIVNKEGMTDQERRILYVGLTRAKHRLVVVGTKGMN